MLITGTSDKIRVVLNSAVATTQLPFTVNYNNYTSSAVTLVTNNGTTNGVTAVDLVTSPSSGQQNQLRYCSILNSDTASATVKIQVFDGTNARVVFQAILGVGDLLQYQLEKGWEVIDTLGMKENYVYNSLTNSINSLWIWRPVGIASTFSLASGIDYMFTLGKADKSYTTFNVMYNVTTQFTTATWAELAIYSGQRINSDVSLPYVRRGFTDASAIWNSTGIKKTSITTSGISPGEQIILVMGYSGTGLVMRTLGIAGSDISDSSISSFGTSANFRPSLMPFIYPGAYNAQNLFINWQAS